MLEFLRNWVFNIVAFVMLLVLLEILMPSGRIKKFVRLVSGFVLIIAIINPVLGLLKNEIDLNDLQISDSNFIDRREVERNSGILRQEQMRQIAEVYRNKLISQLENAVREVDEGLEAKADVIINEDYQSQDFGEIKRVYIYLRQREKDAGEKRDIEIEEIDIGRDRGIEGEGKEPGDDIREKIEDKINRMLGVHEDDIVISLGTG
jgi:stage III sporulation protein AF